MTGEALGAPVVAVVAVAAPVVAVVAVAAPVVALGVALGAPVVAVAATVVAEDISVSNFSIRFLSDSFKLPENHVLIT